MISPSSRRARGFALVGAILVLTVLGILIPALVRLLQKETKDTVSSGKKTTALQLAEAGQDRGAWKLRESDDVWDDAVSGTTISGYDNTTTYTDVAGGQYRIQFSTGPSLGRVTVLSTGKAAGSEEVRAIRAVYNKGVVMGALAVNGALQYKPNLVVEWGPVVTFTSITQDPGEYYPRKYSAGQIVGRDTTNDSNNGAMPANNWSTYDYAAFYDLGAPPIVKLEYYEEKARNSNVFPRLKKGSGGGNATPNTDLGFDSGLYEDDDNPNGVKLEKGTGSGDYYFVCSTCVIYVEGEVKRFPSGTWLDVEAVIVTADCDLNAGGHTSTATIPSSAFDEYKCVNGSPNGPTYWASKGWTNGQTNVPISDVGMHGFLYVGGNINNAGGGATIIGGIFINGTITTNTTTVYYDSTVVNSVQFANATVNRESWDEVRVVW